MSGITHSLRASRAVFCLLLLSLSPLVLRADDNKVSAQLRDKLDELHQQLNAANTGEEQARVKAEVDRVIDEHLAKISENARPTMVVMLKLVIPLQTDVAFYTRTAARFFNSPRGVFETIKTREELSARTSIVAQLAATNTALLARIDALNGDSSRLLNDFILTPVAKMAVRSTVVQQFIAVRTVRDLETGIYKSYQSALALLDAEWGHWQTNAAGALQWENPATADKFKAITDELQSLADRQMTAQQRLASQG